MIMLRKDTLQLSFQKVNVPLRGVKTVKIVYTVADVGNLVKLALKSIRTVRKFFEKEDILVYYTRPRSERNRKKLEKYSTVIEAETLTEPFSFRKGSPPQYYGEKVHLCEVDADTVIFLDADTKVKRNPILLLVGDYDFSARIGSANETLDLSVWESIFKAENLRVIPMPNTGFMIFRNNLHKRIFKDWLKYLRQDLPNPIPQGNYLKDQIALALALAKNNAKIKWMTKKEHAFTWCGELGLGSYVVHGKINPIRAKLALLRRRLL